MRYAIYFTPPADHPLTILGAKWLGRNAFSDESLASPASFSNWISKPARYGFHATLKAPFKLAPHHEEADLRHQFVRFCNGRSPFSASKLVVRYGRDGFTLELEFGSSRLDDLAKAAVTEFDAFRAALSEEDIARRSPERLNERQLAYLHEWGYPHVLEEFNFHMTLTGPVPVEDRATVQDMIEDHFAEVIAKPLDVSGLGLFLEPSKGDNFTVLDWQAFKA